MKSLLSTSLLAVSVLAACAQDRDSQTPLITKSFPAASVKDLRVETSGGNLSVEGTNDAEARVEVYVWPSGRDRNLSKSELQAKLDEEYELKIAVEGGTLIATSKPKDRFFHGNRNLSISFRVFSPHNVSSDLRTSGGNVSLVGLTGSKQDFSTSGGNIKAEDLTGHVTGRTSGGNITVSNVGEDVDLATSGGNVDARHCRGHVKLSTSGGNLSLVDMQGTVVAGTSGGTVSGRNIDGELSAHTSGGNVHLSELSCSLETSTSGGNIDVSMTNLGKYVRISNSGGNVALEIPSGKGIDLKLRGDRISTSHLTDFKGDIDKEHINGSLNGGGIPVTVDGDGGGVSFSQR